MRRKNHWVGNTRLNERGELPRDNSIVELRVWNRESPRLQEIRRFVSSVITSGNGRHPRSLRQEIRDSRIGTPRSQ